MKKSFLIILFMFLSLSFVIFTGCKDPEPPHEHTYSEDWTKDATHHWHASSCGHEVTEGKAAHTFGDWIVTKDPTEEAEGSKERTCTVCGYKATEVIEKLAHTHKFAVDWTKDATHHWHASTCEHTTEVSSKAAHSFGNWTTTKEATEEAEGSKERTCTVCGYKVTEAIAKLEHKHTYSDSWTKDATHHWHASTCGHEVTEGKAAHTFGDWTTTKEPTEEETGTREKSCTVCGYKVTEAIAKLEHKHTYSDSWTKDVTHHWHASTCGHDVTDSKAAHTFGDWTTTKEPTEEAECSRERSCTVCGYTETEEGIICTADNVAEIITSLKASENPYTIIVTGEISSDTISAISTALKGNTSVKVNLDLGNTTGLTSIGNSTFSGCSSLSSVVIPERVTSIGGGAFSGCSSLENFDVDKNNLNYASSEDGKMLLNKDKTLLLAFPTASGDVTIPEGVTSIGNTAFYGCSSLSSVVIPEGVTSIGGGAFSGCSSLSSVVIPEGVTSIGNSTFYGCSSLSSVVIPEGVTSIGSSAFYGCSNLSSVVIPEGVTSIGSGAFDGCSNLSSVVIPEGLTSIGAYAFRDCSNLSSVVIPESVTRIGPNAFYACRSLSSVTFVDTETWYYTSNYRYTNGTQIDVTVPSDNATYLYTYFNSTYEDKYWYKE